MDYWCTDQIDRIYAALKANELAVFFGSGVSASGKFPDWHGLIQRFLSAFEKLDKYKKKYFSKMKRDVLDDYLNGFQRLFEEDPVVFQKTFAGIFPANRGRYHSTDEGKKLAALKAQLYVTMNYDFCFQHSFEEARPGQQLNEMVVNSKKISTLLSGQDAAFFQIHGTALHGARNVILTSRQYDRFYNTNTELVTFLDDLFSNYLVLFVGFGFKDQDIMRILGRYGSSTPQSAKYMHIGIYGLRTKYEQPRLDSFGKLWNTEILPYNIDTTSSPPSHRELLRILEELVKRLDEEDSVSPSYIVSASSMANPPVKWP